ncbi:MarR family winged helix-turn-helix transcriptional regulator [Krasilnikovia sp. MM14-A1004]|uniref:MarR family winged helix-turn-helix transcriptional regulator n=1 Tax=Krasilnikovia sp. MM14-A1004 TaxID=3373541 RepID=UPI00399C87CF
MSASKARDVQEIEIVDAVRRMIASAVLYSHQVAERLRLGPSDAQFMTLLEVHGPLTPGRLAELTGLRTGTVTGVLDRLERAGFVRRERDATDRRKVIVSRVDEQIRERVEPHYAGHAAAMIQLLQRYDADQLALIADFLNAAAGGGDLPD